MTRFDRIIPTESEEQQALFRFCAVEMKRYPELDLLVHIPNEGKRTNTTGGRLKKRGTAQRFSGYYVMRSALWVCGTYDRA